jgi:hypothetical protein
VFLTLPSCRGRRDKSTGENPEKNRRVACPHAPTRSDDRTVHAHQRATRTTRSFFARIPATEPGWPAMSSASQQPRQQFCTVIRHIISPVIRHVIPCHTSKIARAFATSAKSGPDRLTWMPRHPATSSIWVLIQCFADTILAWHAASSALSVDLKLWLLKSEPSEVRFGWSQCRFQ